MITNKGPFVRFAAIALAVAGVLFVLYPALRPFSDESSLSGASAFATTEWIVSHIMAILAFILVNVGLLGLFVTLQNTAVEKLGLYSLVMMLFGTGLTLPYYGLEVFGLYALGQEAILQQNLRYMELAQALRFGAGFYLILAGLLLVAVGSVTAAIAAWKSRSLPRWSGIPLAVGFLLYLPQYMGTQPIRIAHGLIVAAGCLWIAAGLWRQNKKIQSRGRDRIAENSV